MLTPRLLIAVASLAALLVACGDAAPPEGAAESDLGVADGAPDREADPEPPSRRADLGRILSAGTAGRSADRDGDGIDDVLEEELIRRYRPYYKFSSADGHDEDRRPADPVDELRHSQLKRLGAPGDGATDPIAGCGRSGDRHLDPPASLYECEKDASFAVSMAKSTLCLNIENDRYGGVSFAEARADATGLSAHVAADTVNGHPAYKIEYWQFFAFNNQDITVLGLGSYGDHEGDWTSVQVWFDRTERRLAQVLYLIHGKSITFHVPDGPKPTCRSCMVTVQGSHYAPDLGNFFDAAARPAYDDNQAAFYVDAAGYRHVAVYVERGAHEFWPGPWGHAQIDAGPLTLHLNPHNGEGTSYLVPDVKSRPFNLGEVDRPLTEDARLTLAFNGHWGCTNDHSAFEPVRKSPVGPASHCSWKWPRGGPIAACEH